MTHPSPPPITAFFGAYRFLSNFSPSPITYLGSIAPTVEHAFQAAKSYDPALAERILQAATARDAKRMGRAVPIRPDWDKVRLSVMRELLRLKFATGSWLAGQLVATGDAFLLEGNTWGDRYWGAVDGVGDNWLGHLLMARRAELRGGW